MTYFETFKNVFTDFFIIFIGLVGVFGFALVSTIASLFTLFWSLKVAIHSFHCCDHCDCCGDGDMCERCLKLISERLKNMAKTNFSAGEKGNCLSHFMFEWLSVIAKHMRNTATYSILTMCQQTLRCVKRGSHSNDWIQRGRSIRRNARGKFVPDTQWRNLIISVSPPSAKNV